MAINSEIKQDKRLRRLLAVIEAVEQPWQGGFCYLAKSSVETKTRLCPHWGHGPWHPARRTWHRLPSPRIYDKPLQFSMALYRPRASPHVQRFPTAYPAKGLDMQGSYWSLRRRRTASGPSASSYADPELAAKKVYANTLHSSYLQQANSP